ncbi:effector binding domain-containing protein [Rufibacter ruber]|uniref:effector binding domain-containing protein n=1 Tax=Rufibacter ruber TaxID=1783499 RepID=UPI000A4FD18C|nr:effector binding domain-containing protein [Rufibacter ruber]
MTKKFLIYMVVVIAVAVGVYAYVGGFSAVAVTQTQTSQLFIAGKYFEGRTDAKELGELYQQVGQIVEKKQLAGDLAGIYYNNPSKETKTIKAFVGVAVTDTAVALPAGFAVRVVPAGVPVLQGELEASLMVATKKIYTALFDYAEEHQLTLEEFYVERYPNGKPAVIQARLKK